MKKVYVLLLARPTAGPLKEQALSGTLSCCKTKPEVLKYRCLEVLTIKVDMAGGYTDSHATLARRSRPRHGPLPFYALAYTEEF